MAEHRLNRFVAKAAGTSRRNADRWIAAGRISINQNPVTEMGVKVTEKDQVLLDGKPIQLPPNYEYLLLNKPVGYLVTAWDPQQRQTIYTLLPKQYHHLYSIGRLDQDSCGLLLMTNDGDLTQRLLHPRYKAKKTYLVKVRGTVNAHIINTLCSGIELREGKTQATQIHLLRQNKGISELKFVLREGKKRQIRRMCKAVGLSVEYLQRQSLGAVRLGNLPEGQYRLLSSEEIIELQQNTGLSIKQNQDSDSLKA